MNTIIELLKLSPVAVLAALMFMGYDALIAAPIATVYAALVAGFVEKKKVNDIIEAVINNAKEMQVAFFILMVAYAMAEVFMSTGVGASIINLALNVGLTGRTVAVVGIVVTSVLSIATGTSWGTFAACAPIFLWLNHIVGGNIALTVGAIAGGACFGDNIGLISDTTIVSSGIQKVEVIKRIRHQGYWSGLVLLLGIVAFYIAGVSMGLPTTTGDAATAIGQIPEEVWTVLAEKRESAVTLLNQVKDGVPTYMIIPLVLVLIAAFKGLTTLLCLFIGIFSAYGLGLIAGTVENTGAFLDLLYSGLLSILGNAGLADEMAQIVTMGPIIREIVEKNVEGSEEDIETLRLRNATFSDALGVFGSQLIPWHVYIGFYLGIAQAVYPLYNFTAMDIIKYNFLALIAVSTILIATLTGLDRLIPRFGLPSEPKVRLKKSTQTSCVAEEA